MQVAVLIGLAAIALVLAMFARKETGGQGVDKGAVVTVVKQFADQIEAENDRVIEMVAQLRERMDQDALAAERVIGGLRTDIRHLVDQVAILEQKLERTGASSGSGPAIPDYLTPKYQEVAKRLMMGQEPQEIVRELAVGRGEVELVARLMEQEVKPS